jgi:hypothetical protein
MRKLIVAAAGLALVLGASSIARAGILTSLLSFDGLVDTIEDDSRGMVVNFDDDNAETDGFDESDNLTPGDVIYGIIKINQGFASPLYASDQVNDPNRLYAIYALQATGIDPISGALQFAPVVGDATTAKNNPSPLDAVYDGEARSEFTLEKIAMDLGFATAFFTDWADAAFILIEAQDAADPIGTDVNPGTAVPNEVLNGDSIVRDGSVLGPVAGFSIVMIGGFGTDDDFYEVKLTGDDSATLTGLAAQTGNGNNFANFGAGFSVLSGFEDATLLPIEKGHFDGSTTEHEITLIGGTIQRVRTSSPTSTKEWMYVDKGQFEINAVPEPTTMVVWAGLFGGAAGLGFIRRRRNAKAEQKNAA